MANLSIEDDLILEFVAESREHLATIESDLLAMEQAGAAIDDQLVNRVFRAAHSIKGGAGFFDLANIEQLAHRTETVLDLVRSGQIVPDSEVVSILLLAFDKLRGLVLDYAESNSADISDFTAALSSLAQHHLDPDQKSAADETLTVTDPGTGKAVTCSAFDLGQARRSGRTVYLVEYDLIHDVQRKGKTPLEVLNHLIKCGTILATAFDLDSAGTLDDEPSNRILFDVLYSTVLDPWMVSQILDLPAERIHRLDPEGSAIDTQVPDVSPEAPQPEVSQANAVRAEIPHIAAEQTQSPAASGGAASSQAETTVRLNVSLLDTLMTLAGELVLGRNQLNEAVRSSDRQGIRAGAHRISLVTSELQEAVSLTRMQPVSSLFARFPRLVRDLSNELGKDVRLKLEGGDVELDKTILEGLSDPLTHMVRNSVDHGVEQAAVRTAAGKPASGTVTLRARHQAGQVVIEICDDGKGLSGEKIAASAVSKGLITAEQMQTMSETEKQALIFMPGVSTAEKLSNVSGRGVGMDVVKTNLDRLGGKIDIDSIPGKGSAFRIKLPLTLAIIPSLLVSQSGEFPRTGWPNGSDARETPR